MGLELFRFLLPVLETSGILTTFPRYSGKKDLTIEIRQVMILLYFPITRIYPSPTRNKVTLNPSLLLSQSLYQREISLPLGSLSPSSQSKTMSWLLHPLLSTLLGKILDSATINLATRSVIGIFQHCN